MNKKIKALPSKLRVRSRFFLAGTKQNLLDKAMYCRCSHPLDLSLNFAIAVPAAMIPTRGDGSMAAWLGLLLDWLRTQESWEAKNKREEVNSHPSTKD